MAQQPPVQYPLTRFLTALSHVPELLDEFSKSPRSAADGWGLSQAQIELLERGNLQEIQSAVSEEIQGTGSAAVVGWWIRVAEEEEADSGGGVPDWWIRSS